MASTLEHLYGDLMRETGFRFGRGRDSSRWSEKDRELIDACVQSGYRKFLKAHRWSFMEPLGVLSTSSGVAEYQAPDDFGGNLGPMTFSDQSGWPSLEWVAEVHVRTSKAVNDYSGRPRWVAQRAAPFDPATGTRYEFVFHPTPDGVYSLEYRYRVHANKLSESAPVPLGGAEHSETILAGCHAALEYHVRQMQGEAYVEYQRLLAESIAHDNQFGAPERLGYMVTHDSAGWVGDDTRSFREVVLPTVTFEGQAVT